jgi:hypothetical protein
MAEETLTKKENQILLWGFRGLLIIVSALLLYIYQTDQTRQDKYLSDIASEHKNQNIVNNEKFDLQTKQNQAMGINISKICDKLGAKCVPIPEITTGISFNKQNGNNF